MIKVDKQIHSSLDQIHREQAGTPSANCWWKYDGGQDIYSCPHLILKGGEVITRVESMNHYPNRNY